MEKPILVRIDPIVFSVEHVRLPDNDMGEIMFKYHRITVDNSMPLSAQKISLLHEVAHGLMRTMTINESGDEPSAQSLSRGLYNLIRDNPDLIRYIQEGEE